MKTLFAFCCKTGRALSRFVNELARNLTHKGQLRIALSISIPFIAKLEVGYSFFVERRKDKAG